MTRLVTSGGVCIANNNLCISIESGERVRGEEIWLLINVGVTRGWGFSQAKGLMAHCVK